MSESEEVKSVENELLTSAEASGDMVRSPKKRLSVDKRLLVKIAGVVVILLVIVISIVGSIKSPMEKEVIRQTEKLVNMMKNPDSFKIRGDILYYERTDLGNVCYFVWYSANNSYGEPVRNVMCNLNGSWISIDTDDYYKSDYKTEDEYDKAKRDAAMCAFYLACYNAGDNGKNTAASVINGKKIARALHVKHVK